MQEFSSHLLKRLDTEHAKPIKDILPIIGLACASNPRTTVRFVNNLLIDNAINKALIENKTMTKVIPIAYFAITRSLQQRWQEIYRLLLTSDILCTNVADWDENNYTKVEASSPPMAEIMNNLSLDKNLRSLLFSADGRNWLSKKDLREEAINFLRTQRQDEGSTPPGELYDAFVIYAHRDQPKTRALIDLLNEEKFRLFQAPSSLHEGDYITISQQRALSDSKALLILLGPNSSKISKAAYDKLLSYLSDWIERELVRVVLLPDSSPGILPMSTSNLLPSEQIIDLRQGALNFHSIHPLITFLRGR